MSLNQRFSNACRDGDIKLVKKLYWESRWVNFSDNSQRTIGGYIDIFPSLPSSPQRNDFMIGGIHDLYPSFPDFNPPSLTKNYNKRYPIKDSLNIHHNDNEPITLACENRHYDIVEFIIKHRSIENGLYCFYKQLYIACNNSDLEMCKLIYKKCSEYIHNYLDIPECKMIDICCEKGHTHIVKWILSTHTTDNRKMKEQHFRTAKRHNLATCTLYIFVKNERWLNNEEKEEIEKIKRAVRIVEKNRYHKLYGPGGKLFNEVLEKIDENLKH